MAPVDPRSLSAYPEAGPFKRKLINEARKSTPHANAQ